MANFYLDSEGIWKDLITKMRYDENFHTEGWDNYDTVNKCYMTIWAKLHAIMLCDYYVLTHDNVSTSSCLRLHLCNVIIRW